MTKTDNRILINTAVKKFRIAIKNLQETKTLLEAAQQLQEAAVIDLCMTEMTEKLGGIKALVKSIKSENGKQNLLVKHPLQDYFYDTWMQIFPDYGKLSSRDWKAIKEFFDILGDRANKIFIERLIKNYAKSTADWTIPKQAFNLANNFRHFTNGPIGNFNVQVIDRRDGVSNDKSVDGKKVAGIPGIYIPNKK